MKTLCTKCLAGDKSLPHVFPEGSKPPAVAICTPIYDKMSEETRRSLNLLWKPSWYSAQFPGGGYRPFDAHGMLIEKARNMLTEQALAHPDITHVLFADADMAFPPHALLRLMEHDLPIVGGLCHNRRAPYQPIVVREVPAGGSRYMYDLPADGLVECDFTGGAFVLVRRGVFEAMSKEATRLASRDYEDRISVPGQFPERGWWTPIDGMTEDFSFFERARRLGFKVMVDCGLDIGHVGEVVIDRATAGRLRDFRHAAYEEGVTDHAADGKPVATIVIPVYNQRPELLRAAVMSAALQTVPVEVIVVDDGSDYPGVPATDWPENVRVIVHVKNRGIAAGLNTGIAGMTTDYFCWLSSDDMLSPRKVEYQLRAMKTAGVKCSFHRYQTLECDDQGRPCEDFPRQMEMPRWRNIAEQMEWLLQVCAINGSTVMIHRDVLNIRPAVILEACDLGMPHATGPFDECFKYSQDYEFWLRTARYHFWLPISEVLGTRRELNGPAGNLTAVIQADPAKKARHEAEDAAIRTFYGGGR